MVNYKMYMISQNNTMTHQYAGFTEIVYDNNYTRAKFIYVAQNRLEF